MVSTIITMILIGGVLLCVLGGRVVFAIAVIAAALLANIISLVIYICVPQLSNVASSIALREATVYLAFLASFAVFQRLHIPSNHIIDRIYLGLGLFFGTAIVAGVYQNGLAAILIGRELLFPVIIYFLFRFLRLDTQQTKAIVGFFLLFSSLIAIVAIGEFVYIHIFDPYFWEHIHIAGYLAQKYGSFEGPYPLSWINYLPVFIGLPPTFRSVSLMLDPLVTAHIVSCGFVIALCWIKDPSRYLVAGLLGLGTILTFSKAGMLLCVIAVGSQAFRIRNLLLRRTLLGIAIAFVALLVLLILSSGDEAFTHTGSFKVGLETLVTQPFGYGVGSTGYFLSLVSGGTTNLSAIDTTFSVYSYQLGFIGAIALGLLIGAPSLYSLSLMNNQRRQGRIEPITLASTILLGAYSFLSLASAAAFTAVPIFIPMLLLGTLVSQDVQRTRAYALSQQRYQPVVGGEHESPLV